MKRKSLKEMHEEIKKNLKNNNKEPPSGCITGDSFELWLKEQKENGNKRDSDL